MRILFSRTGTARKDRRGPTAGARGYPGRGHTALSHPKPLYPNALRVMRRPGPWVEGRRLRHLRDLTRQRFLAAWSACAIAFPRPAPGFPATLTWSTGA